MGELEILVGSVWSGDCREEDCRRHHVVSDVFAKGGKPALTFICEGLRIGSSQDRFRKEHTHVSDPVLPEISEGLHMTIYRADGRVQFARYRVESLKPVIRFVLDEEMTLGAGDRLQL